MILSACSVVEKESKTLFQFDKINDKSCKLSELLKDVEYIPLETNDSCLLGDLVKYLVCDGTVYASSNNEIFKFDVKGKFVGKLSKIGQGPADYVMINDFEVVSREGRLEIWIAHNKGISRYSEDSFDFLGMIPTRCTILAFTYISDETIVLKTIEDYTFHLCNMEGVFRNAFLERDPANLSVSPLPFIEIDGRKLYPVDQTDEAVVYNERTDSLELLRYASGNIDNLLTRKNNQEYMEMYGFLDQPTKIAETFTRVVTVRRRDNASVAFLRSPNEEKMMVCRDGGNEWDSFLIHPESSIENDLLPGLNVRFFISAFSCDCDDSFLFSVPAMTLTGAEINGRIISEEDNPILIKYRIK